MNHQNNVYVLNSTITKFSNLLTEIEVWRATGFDAMELHGHKLEQFLSSGFSTDDLRAALRGVPVVGVGFLKDIERQGPAREALIAEATRLFELASIVGAGGVQILTGPVDVRLVLEHSRGRSDAGYAEVWGRAEDDVLALAAVNVAELADRAAQYGLHLYLEPLSWAPINGLKKSLSLMRMAARPNVKMVIDYWHCFTSGVTPEEVAQLDQNLIYGVHVCDSLPFSGGIPIEDVLRDVPTGKGVLDLKEWTDAVKATGYRGWWAAETFSRNMQQQAVSVVARDMRTLLGELVGA